MNDYRIAQQVKQEIKELAVFKVCHKLYSFYTMLMKRCFSSRAGTVGGLQPVGTATSPNRLEKFTTLNRYDDILTVVERT